MDEKTPQVPGGGDQVPPASEPPSQGSPSQPTPESAAPQNPQSAEPTSSDAPQYNQASQYNQAPQYSQQPQAGPANQGDQAQQAYSQGQTYAQGAYGQQANATGPQQPGYNQQGVPNPGNQQYGAQGQYQTGPAATAAYPQAGGYGNNGGYPGQPGQQQARDPRKKKRILLISIIAGAVVLLLIIAAVVINVVNSSVYGPQGTVQTYLQNLSQGKANEANKMVSPGDDEAATALLTNDVLGAASERISNIKVGDVSTRGDSATAEFTYRLADTTFDGFITLSHDGKQGLFFDKWKIDKPLVSPLSVFVTGTDSTQATVNGVDVDFGEEYSLDAYPAVYEVGAPTSDFFEAEAQTVTVGTGSKATYESVDIELTPTEALTEEVQNQVNAHLDECAESTEVGPEGCNLNISWFLDFLDVSGATYTVVDYPVVTVDETGSYFDTEGGKVEAVVTGTPFSPGDPTEVSYVTNENWSGFSGDINLDGDEVVLEFY